MSSALLEKPKPLVVDIPPKRDRIEPKAAVITRLPIAAGLLPYGLSLASLLTPQP